jgi:hypothetical protein
MPNVQVNATISARDAASKNIKKVNSALGTLGNTAKNIGTDFRRLGLGAIGLAAGVGAFTASAIKDAAADQAATAKLNAALKARGLATESVAAAVEKQIAAGQKLAFSDDEVRASIEASTRFTKNYATATKIQNVAMELSRSTGMSLADATLQVGKAYQGNGGKLLKTLGIEAKALKGQQALNAILGKTKGSAAAYADTVEGSFQVLAIGAAELKEQFGDAFLPAVTKLFKGLAPYIDRFSNLIKANTPKLQQWADIIVTKILDKLPGLFAQFEANVPKALKGVEKFVDSITGIGKEADKLLGPGGAITTLVSGIGFAFGGLKGAISANLIKGGMDPFTALIVGNIAQEIPLALARAVASQAVTSAVTKFTALFKNIPMSVVPSGTPGAPGGTTTPVVAPAGGMNIPALAAAAAMFGQLAQIPEKAGQYFDNLGALFGDKESEKRFNARIEGMKNWSFTDHLAHALGLDKLGLVTLPTGTAATSGGPAFSGGYTSPMEAKYTSNIYIGTAKVDTVVSDSLTRLGKGGRNY